MTFIDPPHAVPDERGRHGGTEQLADTVRLLRRQVLRMTTEAGSGHPASCCRASRSHALLERHGISRHAIVRQVLALVNPPDARRLRA